LGLLSAIKETQITNGTSSTRTTTTTSSASDDFWESIFRAMGGRNNTRERTRTTTEQPQRFEKFKTVEATVYVEEFGKKIRVRASFTAKILDNFGDPMQVNEVDDMLVFVVTIKLLPFVIINSYNGTIGISYAIDNTVFSYDISHFIFSNLLQ
jgi:hypothetical protein